MSSVVSKLAELGVSATIRAHRDAIVPPSFKVGDKVYYPTRGGLSRLCAVVGLEADCLRLEDGALVFSGCCELATPVTKSEAQARKDKPLCTGVLESSPNGYHDRKFDAGKTRMDLLPWAALAAVGDVLAYGAVKYAEDSWQTVPDARKRYTAALLRHLAAMQDGEEHDPESGRLHATHVAVNALFICWLALKGK